MHIATVSRYPINKTILLHISAKQSSDKVTVAWNMLINIFSKTSITEDEAAVTWENCKACWDLCCLELEFCWSSLWWNLEGKWCVRESKYWTIQLSWWDKAAILWAAGIIQVILSLAALQFSGVTYPNNQYASLRKILWLGFFPLPDTKLDGRDWVSLLRYISPVPSKPPWTNLIIES